MRYLPAIGIIMYCLLICPAVAEAQNPDVLAIRKYLADLPARKTDRLISGQFERWGDAIQQLNSQENFVNIVYQKTGKWVGLTGFEYHNGIKVNYSKANRFCIDYWQKDGLSQLYFIMTNPASPNSNNGGGTCDLKLVLNPDHPYHKYFFNELSKVADGLEELKKNGVVLFVNMFAEATGNWFWWGGRDPKEFISLYKTTYDYLVYTRKLDNLLFVYEPSSQHKTAVEYYPGNDYVDVIGISLFVDYDEELTAKSIPNYQDLKKFGKPLALSQWGPRRGADQTGSTDQPPADNMKLLRGIQKFFPEIVWWMNWSYAYSICTKENSNYNYSELLSHPWVINAGQLDWKKFR